MLSMLIALVNWQLASCFLTAISVIDINQQPFDTSDLQRFMYGLKSSQLQLITQYTHLHFSWHSFNQTDSPERSHAAFIKTLLTLNCGSIVLGSALNYANCVLRKMRKTRFFGTANQYSLFRTSASAAALKALSPRHCFT